MRYQVKRLRDVNVRSFQTLAFQHHVDDGVKADKRANLPIRSLVGVGAISQLLAEDSTGSSLETLELNRYARIKSARCAAWIV